MKERAEKDDNSMAELQFGLYNELAGNGHRNSA